MSCVLRYGSSSKVHAEIIPDGEGWRVDMPDGRKFSAGSLAAAQVVAIRHAQKRYPIMRELELWRWESPDGRSHFPGLPDALASPVKMQCPDCGAITTDPCWREECPLREDRPPNTAIPPLHATGGPDLPGFMENRSKNAPPARAEAPPVDLPVLPATQVADEAQNEPATPATPIPGQSPPPTLPGATYHRRRTKGWRAAI